MVPPLALGEPWAEITFSEWDDPTTVPSAASGYSTAATDGGIATGER